jgi:hypothetical protein
MAKESQRLNSNQISVLRRRGLDPKNYVLVKETYGSLYVRDTCSGKIKIINKKN